jgi:hypothetical protein
MCGFDKIVNSLGNAELPLSIGGGAEWLGMDCMERADGEQEEHPLYYDHPLCYEIAVQARGLLSRSHGTSVESPTIVAIYNLNPRRRTLQFLDHTEVL